MLPAILARVDRRRHMWHTVETDILPNPPDLNETCHCGTLALCAMESRTRYIVAPACISTDAGLETPTSLARDYLMEKYSASPWITHKQAVWLLSSLRPAPLYARPTTMRHGYYLDIQSAYFSIMLCSGWNVDYWPGRWFARGVPPDDFPFQGSKVAKLCLASCALLRKQQIWVPRLGKYIYPEGGNPRANIQVFALLMDVLNSIAREMVAAGAVYVNLDGYILPDFAALGRGVDILKSWGLPMSIKKEGPMTVWGPGSYSRGVEKPKRLANGPITKLARVPRPEWLKERFTGNIQ